MCEWEVESLGKLADVVMGQSPESAFVHETERGLPFLQGCAEFGVRHPSPVLFVDPPQRVAPAGSILISVRAPVGTLNLADRDYGIGRGLAAVIGRRRSSGYLAFAIERYINWLHSRSQGSTFLAIGSADLRSLPIPIRVSSHADELAAEQLNGVDSQITHTEALIAKQEQVRAGLMQDLFTRGVDESGRLRPPREDAPELYHETALGWLPREWEVIALEELLAQVACPMRSGPFGSALRANELVQAGVPLLGIDNVQVEHFEATFSRFVSPAKASELFRYRAFPGDVVITIMGTVGRACVIPEGYGELLSSKHLWTMTFDTGIVVPRLISWQLNFAPWVKAWFRKESQGGIMDAIQSSTLRTLKLPVPPRVEQERMAERYDVATNLISQLRADLRKLRRARTGLLRDLLTPPAAAAVEPGIAAE
ncbi:restriction endonuclease subunit S [Geminicoccaceae bacterium 1502E]|nr:restriction endonuclease subunit S [Geminicoccaceae bacterium 1502E]